MIVIGLFPTASDAALGLNNLAEAEFDFRGVSLVMNSPREVEALAEASGPLNGLPLEQLPGRLATMGLASSDAAGYRDGVAAGGVFIAVDAPVGAEAAAEILKDANARDIRIIEDVRR